VSPSRIVAALLAGLSLAAGALPAPAGAQTATTSPFTPGLPVAPPSTTTTSTPVGTASNTNSTNSGLSGSGIVAIAIGAILVLGGICYFIWRDARKRAPVRGHAHAAAEYGSRRAGSKAPPKPRKLSQAEKRRRKRGRAR
jgi:hypothetical protein